MDPLLRGALAVSLVALLTRAAELRPARAANASERRTTSETELVSSSSEPNAAPCPRGTLPDGNVCIPVPDPEAGRMALSEAQNEHHDRNGRLRVYDQIPRTPDRPKDFQAYRLPIPAPSKLGFVGSGYDLDRPDAEQRRGADLSAVGHGGVDLAQARGTEVRLVNLEHQVGDASVLDSGHLFGNSVVTLHTLREAGALREYLVIYGHLQGFAPGISRGQTLPSGSLLGFVGDSGSPGIVHLHLEVRRAREGINAAGLSLGEVPQNAKTVACDPRNVLELL